MLRTLWAQSMVALYQPSRDKDHFRFQSSSVPSLCHMKWNFYTGFHVKIKHSQRKARLLCYSVWCLHSCYFPSPLFLASTWWSKVEKAGVLKVTRCQQDPFAYPLQYIWVWVPEGLLVLLSCFLISTKFLQWKTFPCAAFLPGAERTRIIPDAALQLSSRHKLGMIFSRYFFKSLKASVDSIPFSMETSIKETGIRCFACTSGTNCPFGKCID